MDTLRSMIDGVGSLQLDVPPIEVNSQFKVQDEAVVRRRLANSNNVTEVLVGRILAFGEDDTALLAIKRRDQVQKVRVNRNELFPVTEAFRRSSLQFGTAGKMRGRV